MSQANAVPMEIESSGRFRATAGQLSDGEHNRAFDFPDQSLLRAISKVHESNWRL
jgi:hypothetical protein